MGTLLPDLRYGLRMLAKNPGFTAVAVLTLAVGITVNCLVFTAYDVVALKPPPVPDPGRVVNLNRWRPSVHQGRSFSYPEYVYYRDHNSIFTGLVAQGFVDGLVGTVSASDSTATAKSSVASGDLETIYGQLVSQNFFSVLGARTAVGRLFLPEKDQTPGPVAVLSYRFWQRRFAADPRVSGKTLLLNGTPFTILGVASPDFVGTGNPPLVPDVWVPLMMQAKGAPGADWIHDRTRSQLRLVGHLKPGIAIKQAQAEMVLLANEFGQMNHDENLTLSFSLVPVSFLFDRSDTTFAAFVALLIAAVSMVLLIACANLANLLLARAVSRQKEFAVRLALGAGRGRRVRQLMTESLLLSLLGGAVGLIFSTWAGDFLWTVVQQTIRRFTGMEFVLRVDPDYRIIVYTLVVSFGAAVLFGLMPALQVSKPDLQAALKNEFAAFGWRLSQSRLWTLLVAGQVAISLVLLIGTGLLLRALLRSQSAGPGFETRKVLTIQSDPNKLRYDAPKTLLLRDQLMERLRNQPGVKSVALVEGIPLLWIGDTTIELERGRSFPSDVSPRAQYRHASSGIFQTLDIPIVRGRSFTDEEARTVASVVVVSEVTGRRFWPGEDPIGKRIKTTLSPSPLEVIGVARDTRSVVLSKVDQSLLYLPYNPTSRGITLLVRTEGNAKTSLRALREAVRSLDKDLLACSLVVPMDDALWYQRLLAQIGAIFAAALGILALVLASTGIVGLTACAVSERVREIGIRVALGATRGDVLRLVLKGSGRQVALGIPAGLAGAAVVFRLLSSIFVARPQVPDLLFGLNPWDPAVFIGVSLFLLSVALLASYVPARRATKVDPMVALRYE